MIGRNREPAPTDDDWLESSHLFRLLFEEAPAAMCLVDADKRFVKVNAAYCRLTGYTATELLGRSYTAITHPDDVGGNVLLSDAFDRQAHRGYSLETRYLHKSGEIIWVHVAVGRLPIPGGSDSLAFAIVEDITERRRAEDELRRRDRILEAMAFAAKHFLLTTSWRQHLQGVLSCLGRAAEIDRVAVFQHEEREGQFLMVLRGEWLGTQSLVPLRTINFHRLSYSETGLERWRSQVAIGRMIAGLRHDLPCPERAVLEQWGLDAVAVVPILDGERAWGFMVFGRTTADSRWPPAELDVLQVAGNILGAAIQRERMEEEIGQYTEGREARGAEEGQCGTELESQRAHTEKLAALGQLAAGIAHEINNPISGIKNAFAILKDAIAPDYPHYHFVGLIEREIDRVADIVRHVYDQYRVDPDHEHISDVGIILRDIECLLDRKLTQRRVRLVSHLCCRRAPIQVRQKDLFRVLLNLIQNAVDVSPVDSTITVTVTPAQHQIYIAIADHGPGIPPNVLPRIFEPFFTTKVQGQDRGMGLGLALSHSLVQAMGGTIEVQTAPGKGTMFTVLLPLTVDHADDCAARRSGSQARGRSQLSCLTAEEEDVSASLSVGRRSGGTDHSKQGDV